MGQLGMRAERYKVYGAAAVCKLSGRLAGAGNANSRKTGSVKVGQYRELKGCLAFDIHHLCWRHSSADEQAG